MYTNFDIDETALFTFAGRISASPREVRCRGFRQGTSARAIAEEKKRLCGFLAGDRKLTEKVNKADETQPVEIVPFYPCMCIVQARMGSTRLPGKVLKKVLGKPLLFYLVERLRRLSFIEGIIIATTTDESDDEIFNFCQKEALHCVRESADDVLSRYYAAAMAFGLQVVIRITADCPLIDPALIEKGLYCFAQHYETLDYLSNTLDRHFARGMDFEIFRVSALQKAYFEATSSYDKEHVTPYITKHPEQFTLANLTQKQDESGYRLTVDEKNDFVLVEHIIKALYPQNPEFDLDDIRNVLKKHPEWVQINQHVVQKNV